MHRVLIIIGMVLGTVSATAQSTLREYTEKVIAYNISMQRATLATEAAEAELRRAKKGQLPAIVFDRAATLDFQRRQGERNWGWQSSLEARQLIYGGGAVKAAVESSKCEIELSLMEEEMARRSTILSAERAYWHLSHAAEYRESIREYVAIIESLREVIARRVEEGYSSKGDLLQIDSRLSDAEYQLSEAEQAYLIALHSYNSLCGMPLDTHISLLESILGISHTPQRSDLTEFFDRHPEQRIAELRAEIARYEVRSTSAPYLPQITLNLFGNIQPTLPHTRESKIAFGGGAVVDFHTPIFHFGERRAAVAAAKSRQLSYEVERERVEDDIMLYEQDAWTNILHTLARLQTSRRSLEIARENLDISTYAYNEGETTIIDVMQAQISWLQSYRNMLAAHYDYAIALAEYRYITGREQG